MEENWPAQCYTLRKHSIIKWIKINDWFRSHFTSFLTEFNYYCVSSVDMASKCVIVNGFIKSNWFCIMLLNEFYLFVIHEAKEHTRNVLFDFKIIKKIISHAQIIQ